MVAANLPLGTRTLVAWAVEDRADAIRLLRDAVAELSAHGRVSASAMPTVRAIEEFLARVAR